MDCNPPETLVLIPGMLCDAAVWCHQVDGLDDCCEVSITDQQLRHDSIEAMADAVLAESPSKFAVAGLGMGGQIALEIIRRHPDRVSRLGLLGCSVHTDDPARSAWRQEQIRWVQEGEFEAVTEDLLITMMHPSRRADPLLLDATRSMCQRVGAETFIRQQSAMLKRRDHRELLPSITCPTTVTCGSDDPLTEPGQCRETASLIPGAHFLQLSSCQQLLPLERPQMTTHLLRAWLLDELPKPTSDSLRPAAKQHTAA